MKVSFIKAPIGGIIGLEMITFVEPLGMECVAGGLERNDHECQIVDLRIDGPDVGLSKTLAFGPDIIGIQCAFTTQRFRVARLARGSGSWNPPPTVSRSLSGTSNCAVRGRSSERNSMASATCRLG